MSHHHETPNIIAHKVNQAITYEPKMRSQVHLTEIWKDLQGSAPSKMSSQTISSELQCYRLGKVDHEGLAWTVITCGNNSKDQRLRHYLKLGSLCKEQPACPNT